MSSYSARLVAEELLDTSGACHGTVLATVCEIETGVEWFFHSCTQCASLVTVVDGKLSCKECKSAIPRFKLHLIVMDETGSTTIVLFDRIVTYFIGRNVQDLISEGSIDGDDVEKELEMTALGSDANNLDLVALDVSCNNSNKLGTPSTKSETKRSSDGNTSAGRGVIEIGEESITKPTKMVPVKVEPTKK
ncbi:replication factor-A carboxy-terminal domain protein [Medicago truncatula]|uniref:Replication factor-A carboxy-terminal domain protein n=1 Tax=Medicago truncatula TaxID=3880 RepID=G7L9T4_MEDTR|nr:replication factor-A carboxy-terminal domain protein [Medicago truncatula]